MRLHWQSPNEADYSYFLGIVTFSHGVFASVLQSRNRFLIHSSNIAGMREPILDHPEPGDEQTIGIHMVL